MCADPETAALAEVCSILREFNCVTGDPKSYHTTPDGDLYRYSTIGFRSAELHNASAALCAALRTLKDSFRPPTPTLYLRSGPETEQDFESKDWVIRIRLAVPGAAWNHVTTKPEGLPYPKV